MVQAADRKEIIAKLQREIRSLQGMHAGTGAEARLHLGGIEQAFPDKQFPVAAVHEFLSYGREQAAATNSFMACLLGQLLQKEGYCIWVGVRKNIYPPALRCFGVDADRILFIEADKNTNALWAIEEALKCNRVAAVVGEVPDLSFTASRRLQLAVESSGVTGLIHRCYPRQENTVACVSRWHIKPVASQAADDMPGVGFPRWEVNLSKIRNGHPGKWLAEWQGGRFVCTPFAAASGSTQTLKPGMYG